MKQLIVIMVLVMSAELFYGQQSLDTIYANEKKNVALFFPKPIRQGIVGSSHFVFTYNREKEQYFGLLQAKPGEESNLLTITNDGEVYSYILKYADKVSKLNYFIKENESIGNEKPKGIASKPKMVLDDNRSNRITYFQKYSEYLLNSKLEKLANKRSKGLSLSLRKMEYDHSEVYLVLEIENESGIDFEIDFLNIYTASGNKKRKSSYQEQMHKIVCTYKLPSQVKDKESKLFVIVVPKFVLGSNEKLHLELNEKKGNRKIDLRLR